MDPAERYSHNSSSHPSHPGQYWDNEANNQQVARVDRAAVNEYIQGIYKNPSSSMPLPSGDPAFYQTAHQMILEKKHRLEQMLLVTQQQAELANTMSAGNPSQIGYAPNSSTNGFMHPQTYQQAAIYPSAYQSAAWGNTAPNEWSYSAPGFVANQEQHLRPAYISPEVQTRGLYMDQGYVQSARTGATREANVVHQPQQPAEPQQRQATQPSLQIQLPAQSQQAQHAHQPQRSQHYQTAPVSQPWHPTQTPVAQTTHLQQTQPQNIPRRHPLQPDEQPPSGGQPQNIQVQKEREQAAKTQKQLLYLAQLQHQHQHQRAQQTYSSPASEHQHFNSPQAATMPLAHVTANDAPTSQTASPQAVLPAPPPPSNTTSSLAPSMSQPNSLPPHESNPPSQKVGHAPETPSRSPPSKPLRSTPSFSLMDLRTSRCRSDRALTERETVNVDASASGSTEGVLNSSQFQVSDGTGQKIEDKTEARFVPTTAISSDNPGSTSDALNSFEPLKHSNPIMSSNTQSNTPSAAAARPPSPTSAPLAGPAPATSAVPASAAVPPPGSFIPRPGPTTSGSTSSVSEETLNTGSFTRAQENMANVSQPVPTNDPAGPASLKVMLERLHFLGIDCVSIVRRAAERGGASTELLQRPAPRFGPAGEHIPLFAPGQPLYIWTQNLKVSKARGGEIAKAIWAIARETTREHGLPWPIEHSVGNPDSSTSVSAVDNPVPGVGPSTSIKAERVTNPMLQTVRPVQDIPMEPEGSFHVASEDPPTAQSIPLGIVPPVTHSSVPTTNSTTPKSQPVLDVPPVQPYDLRAAGEAYNAPPAHRHRHNPPSAPSEFHRPPTQHSYQSHPIYQRAGPQAQSQILPTHQTPQVAPLPSTSTSTSKRVKTGGGGTPALDFLLSLGINPTDASSSAGESDPGSDTIKRKKGKGKAKAKTTEGRAITATSAAAMEPTIPKLAAQEPSIPEPPVAQLGTWMVESEANPEKTQPVQDNATPIQVIEPHSISAETSEQPPPPSQPDTPPSPLLAPTIAVLQEPRSPTTTASPLPEPLVNPNTLEHEDTPQPLVPELVFTSSLPTAPAPVAVQTPTPAPSPGPVQYVALPPALSPTPHAAAPDAQMAEPASAEPHVVLARALRPVNSIPRRPSAPAEYAPLKRKRDSVPGPPSEPSNRTNESWAEGYAREANKLANKMNESNRAKKARSEHSRAASPPRLGEDEGRGPLSFDPEAPPSHAKGKGKIPLFRPESPFHDADESIATATKSIRNAMPRATTTQQASNSRGKQRMIMEVVLPLRKRKSRTKPQDLTMDDESESGGEVGGLDDDDEEEEEEDMKMLRRRLREHKCKWRGCVGPAVLSSVELLGVHLKKKHGPRRDASGHYTCRWGDCGTQYRRSKDLWEHVLEQHILKPLWCPYQNCARAAIDRYQLDIHIRRKHRGRSDEELRPLARPEECAPLEQILRPEAFPADVPYFRLMGMMLRYNVLPSSVSAQWHAKNGPKILRKISATISPVRMGTPFVLSQTPRPTTSEAGGNLPAFGSPVAVVRPYVRLDTVPPDVLGNELERVGEIGKGHISPARSHITVHSDDETPPPPTPSRGRGRPRGRPVAMRGRGRGRGTTTSEGGIRNRISAPQAPSTFVPEPAVAPVSSVFAVPQTPVDLGSGSGSVSTPPVAPSSSRAAPSLSKPRIQMFVELPSQVRKQRK